MANNQLKVTINGKSFTPLLVKRPKFQILWNQYLNIGTEEAPSAYNIVGGKANELHINDITGSYQNACALRMSYGLNKGGFIIKSGTVIKNNQGQSEDVYRVPGSDGLPYILKVEDMIEYVTFHFGKPEISMKTNGQNIKKNFLGKKGIIVFRISGWDDATGHVTLWDGNQVGDYNPNSPYFHDYFNYANTHEILLWELK